MLGFLGNLLGGIGSLVSPALKYGGYFNPMLGDLYKMTQPDPQKNNPQTRPSNQWNMDDIFRVLGRYSR